jgi:hypothetical protein
MSENIVPERPMRNRPIMPNVAELAGEHRDQTSEWKRSEAIRQWRRQHVRGDWDK